jgi:hypothetical protein
VLNISELATMWHLPIGANPDQLHQGLYLRLVPVPSTMNEPSRVQIGQAVKGGQAIPVALSHAAQILAYANGRLKPSGQFHPKRRGRRG